MKGYDIITLEKVVERDYTIPDPQTAQEVIGYYSRRIAEAGEAALAICGAAPKVREFFEQKAFGQSVDLIRFCSCEGDEHGMSPDYVCVGVFSKELKELTIAEQEPVLLEPERMLSTCQPFPWSPPCC